MLGARAAAGFPPLALGLAALAWAILLAWDASPYGRYLNHGDWTTLGLGAAICAALPGGPWLVGASVYAAGWVTMSAAMMLPTALPLIRAFDRMIAARPARTRLHLLLIGLARSGQPLLVAGARVNLPRPVRLTQAAPPPRRLPRLGPELAEAR
jgi:predicted metal-binding membrane protein